MKTVLGKIAIICLSATLILAGCGQSSDSGSGAGESSASIKIGVLFSDSGVTAMGEKGLKNATMMAIEEINAAGGVKGQQIVPVYEDYASDPSMAATKAKKLLMQDNVTAIIGGYTSASRQAILPVVEQNDGVLVYPMQFEGEEYSENVMYMGPVPNQGLELFIPWLLENKGKKFYLIGSDYVFPVQTNKQVKKLLELHGGEVVGEEYLPMGHSEFASVINQIKEAKPDVIFSTLVVESASAFYKQYANYGLSPETMPIASIVTNEMDLAAMGGSVGEGHISALPYFQSVNTPENQAFVEKYTAKFGPGSTDAYMESAYYSMHILAKALEAAEDMNDSKQLIDAFKGIEFMAPQGKVTVDMENNHTMLNFRIGIANKDGQFDIVKESPEPIAPQPWSKLLFPDHEEPWKK
ncbi:MULTISPECIES: transporter substrate-binding domain-containing protein [unclassified Paenibacillus]|uniref:transporter substrate-binding domain-containing protein n=1 Tax=unclassified Paenibacillus TaxID=185978 RepID=UPI0024076C1A|nr:MULTISPECIES: transporter substrate-binding domain-containing protein [unclassified Paenibacillus]MDF9839781.1 urea transport system substrate-binding protein [Paenibacillus sp. PastF-2]MDF9846361.1 urea transport system substrate-binding protein [Paenibacillus sp. PastM-2]MDF9853289.1 urea transport system substrate-binding protein [Paenibacillus sp. PastF-1]MDH6478207.1 urea transport system substrate-binding protein [Paenibacillus sp. PastH-2]MDH6506294.1 urea transport system substrate-